VTLDGEPAGAERAPETVQPKSSPPEPAALGRLDARISSTAVRHGAGPVTDERDRAPTVLSEPGAADGSWSFLPTTVSSAALAGRALDEATRAGVAVTVAEETKTDAARRKPLPTVSVHEIELGLVPGAVLASLSRELVRRSRVPTVSHAVLQFNTDEAERAWSHPCACSTPRAGSPNGTRSPGRSPPTRARGR
jgi:hypothetical protein